VSANFEGYIYEIYNPNTNLPIDWYPFGTSGKAVFAYSTYWRSLTVDPDVCDAIILKFEQHNTSP
jgi:hypothetical protein